RRPQPTPSRPRVNLLKALTAQHLLVPASVNCGCHKVRVELGRIFVAASCFVRLTTCCPPVGALSSIHVDAILSLIEVLMPSMIPYPRDERDFLCSVAEFLRVGPVT